MTVLAGVDEAGYGPRLGPLVSSAAAFRLPGEDPGPGELWEALSECVARPGRGARGRLAVGDSKALYARGDISRLERSLLAFFAAAGLRSADPGELCAGLLSDNCRESLAAHPWYADRGERLPLAANENEAEEAAGRLELCCAESGVEVLGVRSRLLAEGEFNRRVGRLGNKASVLLELVAELLTGLRAAAGDDSLAVYVDRLGGRTDYRPLLAAAFPQAFVWEEERGAERQAYRLDGLAGPTRVEFRVKADRDCFPVALASMTSKYLREIFMRRFNAYWREIDPQVPATSGYWVDAGRFLEATRAHRQRMEIADGELVRCR